LQGWLSSHRISPGQREALLSLLDIPAPTSARGEATALGFPSSFPVHATLIALLTHLEMDEEEAALHWRALSLHRKELTWRLGRDPGTRVAAFDYFVNQERLLARPQIVDESVLDRAEQAAEGDGITGLPHARTFLRSVRAELRRAERRVQEFCVVVAALDGFGRLLRSHGRIMSDAILRRTAEVLRSRLRDMDLASRLEGGHFGLLLPMTRRSGGYVASERIREALEDSPLRIDSTPGSVRISLSAGVAAYPLDGRAAGELLDKAHDSLSLACSRGGNQVVVHPRERRRDVRLKPLGAPVRLPLLRSREEHTDQARVRDLSLSGVLLETARPLDPGERIGLELVSPSGGGIRLEGEVVRRPPPVEGGHPLAAIRFVAGPPEGRKALEGLLDGIRRRGVE
jgi:diguanylate cyclase (GGDEF)-like protein